MKTAHAGISGFQETLERQEAELIRALQDRDGINIEKSADQLDEIQFASERELEIRNVDRESTLLRQVQAALRRIHDGSFGACVDCDWPINPKRLAAVPWALRCIECQQAVDSDAREGTESARKPLVRAA
jgi:DnaK suppressor protein